MISREEVISLAGLARLELGEAEIASLQKDISTILDYVGKVSAFAPSGEAPTVPLNHNVMRDDVPRDERDPLFGLDAAVRAAFPKEEQGYNVVQKILIKDA